MSRATHSGLSLPSYKQHSRDVAIMPLPPPDVLVLPLNQHSDAELLPCVQQGDSVRKGQLIAQPTSATDHSPGACLHAPVSGRVIAVEPRATPQRDAAQALSIVIRNDHLETVEQNNKPSSDWSQLQPLALCQLIARGGIAGLGGAVFPTATKLVTHARQPIEHLLINGVECEPYITCDDRLMRERAADILDGVQILLHAAQAQHCIIAIEADKPEALHAMQVAVQTVNETRITLRSIAPAYPSGDEGQLIAQLTGREIPRGGLPMDIGVVVQNVATAYACARWIKHGEPLISRIITVAGPGISKPGNLEVRLGTAISDVLAACGDCRHDESHDVSIDISTDKPFDTLIMGGAMMGRALAHDQLPVVKASNCLLVVHHSALKPPAPEMPCIRCGECTEACPAHLLPQQLLTYVRSDNRVALQELGLSDCIECGCCDYVCPSNITLAARFHAAKQLVGR